MGFVSGMKFRPALLSGAEGGERRPRPILHRFATGRPRAMFTPGLSEVCGADTLAGRITEFCFF